MTHPKYSIKNIYLIYIIICSLLFVTSIFADTSNEELFNKNNLLEELSIVNAVSEGFEELTNYRGVSVASDYKDLSKAISQGLKCVQISVKGTGMYNLSESVIDANKNAKLTIGFALKKGVYKKYCLNGLKILLVNTNSKSSESVQLLNLNDISIKLNFSFDNNEDWIVTIISDKGETLSNNIKRQLTRKQDPNYLAKYKILLNELKAKSIRGLNTNYAKKNGTPLWIRQIKSPNKISATPNTPLKFIQSTLQTSDALLILDWKNNKLAAQLVGKNFISKEYFSQSKNDILEIKNNMSRILSIKGQITQRAPVRLRGFDIIKPVTNKITLSAKNMWEKLGSAFLHKEFSKKLDGINHLMIIAPGELATFPFTAVINPITGHHLIEDFSLSLVPDLVSLTIKNDRWLPDEKLKALVIGDPLTPDNSSDYSFPPLPGARKEALSVARIWETNAYIGKQATIDLIEQKISHSSVIHLAAHGIARPEKPLRKSFIAMSGTNDINSRFTGMNISNNNLEHMKIAVMSACQSGLGYQHKQGTIGLARAFYLAGVPRVVMSLWNVDDNATEMLMTNFHQYLKEKKPADALRDAILSTKKYHPEPSKWASFMMFGRS